MVPFTCTFAQRAQATSLIKKTRILRSHTAACCGSTRLYKSDGQSVRWSDGRSWGVPPRVGNRRVILIATKWKLASLPDGHTLNFAQAHAHTHMLETTGHPTDAAFHMLQTQKCALETPGHRRVTHRKREPSLTRAYKNTPGVRKLLRCCSPIPPRRILASLCGGGIGTFPALI